MSMLRLIIALTAFAPAVASAEYYVNGKVQAETCYSFGIRYCSYAAVYAVLENGSITPFPYGFKSVSDFSERTGTCAINVGTGIGVKFLTKDESGAYEEISSPDRVTFPCARR